MSFDFAPDGPLLPPPGASAPRRRRAARPAPSPHASPQLAFMAAGDAPLAEPAAAVIEVRLPVTIPAPPSRPAPPRGDGRQWSESGWTARCIESEEAGGWAVEMRRLGEPEPVLVAPWHLDRDCRGPQPLDEAAFNALRRQADGLLERQARQFNARLHRRLSLDMPDGPWEISLDIVPDDYEPHALLTAFDSGGEQLAQTRVAPDFRLTEAAARAWIDRDFRGLAED